MCEGTPLGPPVKCPPPLTQFFLPLKNMAFFCLEKRQRLGRLFCHLETWEEHSDTALEEIKEEGKKGGQKNWAELPLGSFLCVCESLQNYVFFKGKMCAFTSPFSLLFALVQSNFGNGIFHRRVVSRTKCPATVKCSQD